MRQRRVAGSSVESRYFGLAVITDRPSVTFAQ